MSHYPEFDVSLIKTQPFSERSTKVRLEDFARPPEAGKGPEGLAPAGQRRGRTRRRGWRGLRTGARGAARASCRRKHTSWRDPAQHTDYGSRRDWRGYHSHAPRCRWSRNGRWFAAL